MSTASFKALPLDAQIQVMQEKAAQRLLAQTLQRHDGVVARAAKALGMSRTSLVSRLSTLGIER